MLSVHSLRGRPIGRLIRVVEMLLNEVFLVTAYYGFVALG